MGPRGGGGTRRSSISAAARGSGSPELAKSGTPGVGLNRGWAKEGQRGTRKPLVGLTGFGRALGGACKNDGGSARWRFAGRGVPATGVAYGVQAMVKKHQGDGLNLTKGAGWPE